MKIEHILIEPNSWREPFYDTLEKEDNLIFNCIDCGQEVTIYSNTQTKNVWKSASDLLSEEDIKFLKEYFKIGLSNKSQDGGFPVFDLIMCEKCLSKYISYCGVREYYNSLYRITINALIKISTEPKQV